MTANDWRIYKYLKFLGWVERFMASSVYAHRIFKSHKLFLWPKLQTVYLKVHKKISCGIRWAILRILFSSSSLLSDTAVHNFLGPTKKKQKWIIKTRVLAFSAFLLTSFFISTVYCLKSFWRYTLSNILLSFLT